MKTVRFLTSNETRHLPSLLDIVARGGRHLSAAHVDGFFSGLALIPVPLAVEEWLVALFGEGDIPFPSERELRELTDIVVRLHNRFRDNVRLGKAPFPEKQLAGDREAVGDWCRGLLQALLLQPEWWLGNEEDMPFAAEARRREGMSRFVVLQYFAEPEKLDDLADFFATRENELLELLPHLYQSLWRDSIALLLQGTGATTDIGRNEPCPCGSGKKFKKCCGA